MHEEEIDNRAQKLQTVAAVKVGPINPSSIIVGQWVIVSSALSVTVSGAHGGWAGGRPNKITTRLCVTTRR